MNIERIAEALRSNGHTKYAKQILQYYVDMEWSWTGAMSPDDMMDTRRHLRQMCHKHNLTNPGNYD